MPLTAKGEKIMEAMKEKYGEEKGEEVFYASKNKGTISGVDANFPLGRLPPNPRPSPNESAWAKAGAEIKEKGKDQDPTLASTVQGGLPPVMQRPEPIVPNVGDHRVVATHHDIARAGGAK